MEFVDILFILVAVAMSRVFTFLLQQWSLPRHGDSQQQKEKTVILPPFLDGQAGGLVCFCGKQVQREGHHLSAAVV
jgi:hypothetical protein